MGLTAIERETVINFNDAEEMAEVYTHQRRVITALKKNSAAVLLEEGVFQGTRWAKFELPKDLVSFRSKRRVLSEAERIRRADRLAAARGRVDANLVDPSRRSVAGPRSAASDLASEDADSSSSQLDVSTGPAA